MIVLRPITRADLPAILRWRNDPEINQDLATSHTSQTALERWHESMGTDHHAFAIIVDDVFVGYTQIGDLDTTNRKCDIGVVVGEKHYWSRGIGTVAARVTTEIAFTEVGMHRAVAVASERNRASIRCFTKIGYVEEGRLRDANLRDGEFFDLVILSVLEHEWQHVVLETVADRVYSLTP